MAVGADLVLNFADGGLPTTCGDPTEVGEVSLGILHEFTKVSPDLIFVKFGSCLLSYYNALPVLDSLEFRQHIVSLILTAEDTAAAWGLKRAMEEHEMAVTLITDPLVNNVDYVSYIEEELGCLRRATRTSSLFISQGLENT
ncbi:hypothetical protein BDV28DRAFT_150848 [Aspergillus coremiiformis]|uniref:Uncharacterized protein n=1 Tax=Aspergillus coremiiformis TaxID=138285 RepID=A0A5N6YYL5_9EURO|nr:hypothetical protein BDV28DRAFT_150848 [Aspergillus coremiiformis]